MPRTYSFDHFTVPTHDMPAPSGDQKARASGKRVARGDGRPRYGHRFAETEELAHVRQMNAQLEELAGVASPKLSMPREPEPERAAPAARIGQGPTLGALPIAAAQVQASPPEPEDFRDLLGAGARHLRLIRHCVVDGVAAGFRLAALPLQAVKLTARKLDPRRWSVASGRLHATPA